MADDDAPEKAPETPPAETPRRRRAAPRRSAARAAEPAAEAAPEPTAAAEPESEPAPAQPEPEAAQPEPEPTATRRPAAQRTQTFEGLGSLRQALAAARQAPAAPAAPTETPTAAPGLEPAQPKRDEFGRSYATGKRKNAVARVWIKPGNGKIEVNGRDSPVYFARPVLRMLINQPFVVADRLGQFDVWCTVNGGGLSGQAGAVRHGISRALTFYEPGLRPLLKHGGFLTRDSRVVERKKYGKHKARRRPQYSKR